MPTFGKRSLENLALVDHRLIEIARRVIPYKDFSVLSGFRGKAEQEDCLKDGRSTKPWPESTHNFNALGRISPPSCGVDVAPYFKERPHIRWEDKNEFILLAGRFQQAADHLGYEIRWGGNWDQDDDALDDQTFQDLGHFEIVGKGNK